MYRSQQLALKYFAAAMALFGIVIVAGLLASTYYVQDGFLLNKLDFSVAKIMTQVRIECRPPTSPRFSG
jgi:nitric oxide reductase subunit B